MISLALKTMNIENDFPLKNAKTGEPTSLKSILSNFDSNNADFTDAVTLCDHIASNLLGLELGDEDHVALLNWLMGHETELVYKGQESVFSKFQDLIRKVEIECPIHPIYTENFRQLNIIFQPGSHRLGIDQLDQFQWLEKYLCMSCKLAELE